MALRKIASFTIQQHVQISEYFDNIAGEAINVNDDRYRTIDYRIFVA